MKRYAIVGTGGRATMFMDALGKTYRDSATLVAFCDVSQTRMDWHNARLAERYGYSTVPTYLATDFERMIEEQKPDTVIVCTVDCFHHQYIVRAMELGCDVISEKPMTTDAPKARAILDAIERTGRDLRVTFNYRYAPAPTKVRELIMQNVVGRPQAVDFSWTLDTSHGADYFRRWHREKANSGGLMVHKATHHFDLINWWIQSRPETVFAMGELKFYGKANAEARGEHFSYSRYTGEPAAVNDPFALFLNQGKDDPDSVFSTGALKGLYLDAEADSGYVRDRNVFGEPIDIEDTMAVMARYTNGVILNYSLIAYSPWEGYRVAITGDRGRLEYYEKHGSHIIAGQSDEEMAQEQAQGHEKKLTVFPMFGTPYGVEIPEGVGAHGGGDRVMLEHIFGANPPEDPFHRAASHLDGAASILMGISANEAFRTGKPVICNELVPLPQSEDES